MSHIDLKRKGLPARAAALLELARDRLSIAGPGETPNGTGMLVEVHARGGTVFVTIDGCNVFEVSGAERIEVKATTYYP